MQAKKAFYNSDDWKTIRQATKMDKSVAETYLDNGITDPDLIIAANSMYADPQMGSYAIRASKINYKEWNDKKSDFKKQYGQTFVDNVDALRST